MPPATRPGSSSGDVTAAAQASGKLAPHNRAGGRMANAHTFQVEEEHLPGIRSGQNSVGPVRQDSCDHARGPRDGQHQQELANAKRELRVANLADEPGSRCASHRQSDEEDSEDDGEDIDRGEKQHRHQPGPEHFSSERASAGKGGGEVDGPVQRASRVGGLVRRRGPSLLEIFCASNQLSSATRTLIAAATNAAVAML